MWPKPGTIGADIKAMAEAKGRPDLWALYEAAHRDFNMGQALFSSRICERALDQQLIAEMAIRKA